MIEIQITTTDNEKINGLVYTHDVLDNDVVHFIHSDGGEASIPAIEIEKAEFGEENVEVGVQVNKVEGPAPKPAQKRSAPRRKSDGPTKLELCVEVLKPVWQEMSRKECINILVQEVGMTPAGASTYYSNAKKILKAG